MMNKFKIDLQKYLIYFSISILVITYLIMKNDPYSEELYDEMAIVQIIKKMN
jgi:hypothetical protein